jgi:hypothetical protein
MDILRDIFVDGKLTVATVNTEATSWDSLFRASNGDITKRTLNTMALQDASNYYTIAGANTHYLQEVNLSLPTLFNVTTSNAIPSNPNLVAVLTSQTANTVFAGPNGFNGTPGFRSLVIDDMPGLQTIINSKWTIGGDSLSGTGAIGSTTNQNITLIRNSVVGLTLKVDGVTDVKKLAVGRVSGFGGSSWDSLAVFGGNVTIGGRDSATQGSYDLNFAAYTLNDTANNATRKSRIKFGYYDGVNFVDKFKRTIEYWRTDDSIVIGSHSSVIADTATTAPVEANSIYFGSTGTVSIGVNANTYKLDVSGTGHFSGNAIFDASVGIGNTSPGYPLHVSNSGAYHIGFTRPGVGTGTIGMSPQMVNSVGDILIDPQQASSGFFVRTRDAANAIITALGVDRDGNIGIGTNGPTQKVDVRGNLTVNANQLLFNSSTSGQNFIQSNVTAAGTYAGSSPHWKFASRFDDIVIQAGLNDSNKRNITLRSGDTGVGLVINTSGYAGIGINNPLSDLHLYNAVAPILSVTAGNTSSGLRVNILGQSGAGIGFRVQSAGTDIFRIDMNSWVSVGGSQALYPLHVTTTNTVVTGYTRTGVGTVGLGVAAIVTNSTADAYLEGLQASSGIVLRSRNASNSVINALVIDRDGNIGINTVSPAFKFDLNGTSRFVSDATFESGVIITSTATLSTHAVTKAITDTKWTNGGDAFAGTTAFLGTTNNVDLQFIRNGVIGFTLRSDGVSGIKKLTVGRGVGPFNSFENLAAFGGNIMIGGWDSAVQGSYDLNMAAHTTNDNAGNATRKSRIKFGYYDGVNFVHKYKRTIEYWRSNDAIVIGSHSTLIADTATTVPVEASSLYIASDGATSIGQEDKESMKFLVNGSVRFKSTLDVITSVTTPLLIGGTGTASNIVYKTTTGVGGASSYHSFVVGNNGALEALRINYLGNIGIGTTGTTDTTLKISRNMDAGSASYGLLNEGQIQSGSTALAIYNRVTSNVASSGVVTSLALYGAYQGTNSGTITNQYGFYVDSTLIGANNNYGFFGNIGAAANRWNIYMAGNANNYLSGNLTIGSLATDGYSLRVSKNITAVPTQTAGYGILNNGQFQTDISSIGYYYATFSNTVTGSTLSQIQHYSAAQGTLSGAVTSQYGFYVNSNLTGATNNYGIFSNIGAAANRWNIYVNGTANNYFAGNVWIGLLSSSYKFDVSGTGHFSGEVTFDSNLISSSAPSIGSHLVNKAYVDTLTFLKRGDNVKTVALSNVTSLSGTQTISGYALAIGENVLLTAQSTASQNGVWVVASGAWTRSTNNDSDAEIRGAYHYVTSGTYANSRYGNTNSSAITVGTTAITYDIDFGAEVDPQWTAFKNDPLNDLTTARIGTWNTAYGWGNHASAGYAAATSISGTLNYIPKFTAAGTIGNSAIFDNGTNIGIGTSSPSYFVNISSANATAFAITRPTVGTVGMGVSPIATNSTADIFFEPQQASGGVVLRSRNASNSTINALIVNRLGNVGIGNVNPAYKLDVTGDINLTGKFYINGSAGADHQFVKSNGTTTQWAYMNTGELEDKNDIVMWGTYNGERGFQLYSDNTNTYANALVFSNQRSGVALGLHGYSVDSATDTVKEFGLHLDVDGDLYHKRLNGTRSKIATIDMLTNIPITWTGGAVSNHIELPIDKYIKWDNGAAVIGYENFPPPNKRLYISTQSNLFIGSGGDFTFGGKNKTFFQKEGYSAIEIDFNSLNSLPDGQYVRGQISISGGIRKLTFISD